MDEIQNKVAGSGLVTIDLEELYTSGERIIFDIQPHLFNGLMLREKDFREFIKGNNWAVYHNKIVGIICSADAIVPTWAYMLLSLALEPYAKKVFFGDASEIENYLFEESLSGIDPQKYKDARVVIKGCGEKNIPVNAYVRLAGMLKPHVKSIMYGEPCSTVPLFKAKA